MTWWFRAESFGDSTVACVQSLPEDLGRRAGRELGLEAGTAEHSWKNIKPLISNEVFTQRLQSQVQKMHAKHYC